MLSIGHFARHGRVSVRVLRHRRMAARAAWKRYFDGVDVFLCPVNITPAFPHDRACPP